MDKPE